MTMDENIRRAEEADIPVVLDMLREFAEFEGLSDELLVTSEALTDAMFGEDAFATTLIAETDGEAVGYAIFFPFFASFRGERGVYLEDLFVRARVRGRGVGVALLKAVAREAKAAGAVRIDLQVLRWNENAIDLYRRLGATGDAGEEHYKFSDVAFDDLARVEA